LQVDRLWAVVIYSNGGPQVLDWCVQRYVHRRSVRAIAADAKASKSAVFASTNKLRSVLAMHGLLPDSWRGVHEIRDAPSVRGGTG
jgi:hypothetical protein